MLKAMDLEARVACLLGHCAQGLCTFVPVFVLGVFRLWSWSILPKCHIANRLHIGSDHARPADAEAYCLASSAGWRVAFALPRF